MQLFPRIQFIVTSHSPLFVLGMEEAFGKGNIQLIDLPSGMNTTSERFSEFHESFHIYEKTRSFENTLRRRVNEISKPLILVEGKTDVKFLKKSFMLRGKEDWLTEIDIDEIGITTEDGKNIYGGESNLDKGFEFLKHNINAVNRKILFLYDSDSNITEEKIRNISKAKVPCNTNNAKISKGSENLFRESLFTSDFYVTTIKNIGYGGESTTTIFDKVKFCNYICDELARPELFIMYEQLVFPIIEKFLANE